ncbi:putative 7-carboxy-7-deazaguanine synthase QueE [Intestinibacter sp.]|uniref:putative 7-carboxy-7-deazaguanine synthase QueE n=1 Tax=Intestinibacter sp. TaxID=1965304 RepID=UPI002A90B8D1|nr:putative 7-carboxy-7-deazaguanine synthase QueE [Intestinibacter sp.]MDY5211724.1 putative 7-carboxy-7-deazaguanine synthase QueE [Intestinibacter sp.]
MFNIIEKFVSIDGEGPTAGELATFIRFQGCNLRCSWCDTTYSFDKSEITEVLSAEEIYDYIKSTGVSNVTLTGGEPLFQKDIDEVLSLLNEDEELVVHIETNGAIDILPFKEKYPNIIFILDYKLGSSNMTHLMKLENFNHVTIKDVYKFVLGSNEDLHEAYKLITKFDLTNKCLVYFSPVFGAIELEDIVEFMKHKNLNKVKLQVQLHKVIWDPNMKGV